MARLAEVRAMLGVLGLDPLDEHWAGGGATAARTCTASWTRSSASCSTSAQAARARKDCATADAIRDQLQQSGLAIEDTPHGPRWTLSELTAESAPGIGSSRPAVRAAHCIDVRTHSTSETLESSAETVTGR